MPGEPVCDNGQHILIGAYVETLALMRRVGVDAEAALLRTPCTCPTQARPACACPAGRPAQLHARRLTHSTWPLSGHGWRC